VLVHFFEQHLAKALSLKEMPELENGGFIRQTVQFQASELAHGFDLVQGIFHRGNARVIEQLHAVNSEHGRQRIRRPRAGISGLHAEVKADNDIVRQLPVGFDLSKVNVSTIKLSAGRGQGEVFLECYNCGDILHSSVNILIGIK